MFRRTILPITSSEIIKTGLKGRIEGQTVNEEVNIFLEGQIDSGFISEITIGGNVYKGFLVKMDANPIPPPANRDPTTSSMIIPSMQQKGIPGFDNLVYPSPLMSSAAFHPAPSFVPPPPPQTIALPPIEDESEKKDKKRKKEKRREKRDDSSEEEKKDKKKKKKKKDNEKEKEKRPDSKSSSSKSKTQSKSSSKPSASQTAPYPQASQISFPPWFDMSQIAGNPASPSPLGWTGQSLVSSLSTKCNSCQQILLYPSGEKTVRCPSCKAILDVEHAESSVLRPCMGCGTMLGNPTSAIKVLCPLCKTTMDWNQAGKASLQREKSGEKPIINLENDEDKSTSKSAEESAKSPVEEKKENGVDHKEEEKTKTEPTTPTEDKS